MRKLAIALLGVLVVSTVWSIWHPGAPTTSPTTPPSAVTSSSTGSTPSSSTSSLTSPQPGPVRPTPTSTATSAAPTDTSEAGEGQLGDDSEADGQPVAPDATAVPRDQLQARRFARYVTAAEAFARAFARPPASTSPAQRWAGVRPQLTSAAAEEFEGTDPQEVPFGRVTGPGAVVPTDAPTDLLTVVRVPTDAGVYLVEMQTDETGIHISALTPPQRAGS